MKLLLFVTLFLGQTLAAQTLEVSPARVLSDEPATIRVTGLEANERVTVRAELMDGEDVPWESSADFVADAKGVVDLSTQEPVSGSYKRVSAMGLIWSMMPKDKKAQAYVPPKELAPQTIDFQLLRKGQMAASARLEQLAISEGVHRIDVRGTLHGVLFEPATGAPHPAVLVLGGSNGGLPLRQAAWLASHGFAAFALAYFRYEDLPEKLEAIPLEYFGSALGWMAKRPEIAANHMAVMGTSRGGELALQLGSMYSQVTAVVAYVPANTRHAACCGDNRVPYAWTWQGKPLPFTNARRNPEMERDAAIQVEHTRGPLLLISGEDDGVWESSGMCREVVDRLKSNHFQYPVEHLRYPHAGHASGHPGIIPAWHGRLRHPLSGREVNLGGSVEGNAQSSLDATPRVLEFLKHNLAVTEQPASTGQR